MMESKNDIVRLTKDAEWRKKFYKSIDPNQAVGIAESIVAVLLRSAEYELFPYDWWIDLSDNWALKFTNDGKTPYATLYPVYNGVVEEEHGVWNWKG
jgi:hypothetical protein